MQRMSAVEKTVLTTEKTVVKDWYVIDAEGQRLGRLATAAANLLRGKHKPTFANDVDAGDFVIVVNADKVVVTGKKIDQKVYYRHSGRPGGMKMETFRNLQRRLPERIVEKAIKGMIPHTRLGRQQYTKLKVYKGAEHPHQAQQPKSYALNTTGENS
jgi:large subunit ribosomal protein L13